MKGTDTPTGYAHDIQPMFRPGDIGCMTRRGVRIGDAHWMCDPANHGFNDHGNARRVHAALSQGFMPPDGKWPQDWLDIYSKWMTDGFQP